MGVNGFTNYIHNSLLHIAPITNLSNASLVIDGNSFTFTVARQINWLQGSAYTQLKSKIIEFLKKIDHCSLTVVFDGSLPEYKTQERHHRNREKLERQQHVLTNAVLGSKDIHTLKMAATLLPPFAVPLVIDTIRQLNIPVIIAIEEADHLIASIAKSKDALVLSQDSDFFIYDIPGYIPFDTLEFKYLIFNTDK